MWLREEIEKDKNFFRKYWPNDTFYRMLIVIDISSIMILDILVSFLPGKEYANTKSIILALFTFTITNVIPTIYESYNVDHRHKRTNEIVKTNKRKLTVVGNVFNALIIASIIIVQCIEARIPRTATVAVGIVVAITLIILFIIAGIHGKKERAKQAQENQKNNEQEKPPK